MRLGFFCMREEEVGFIGNEVFFRNLFDAKQNICLMDIFRDDSTGLHIIFIRKAAGRGWLYQNMNILAVLFEPFTLGGSEGNPVIGRNFSFTDEGDSKHAIGFGLQFTSLYA